MYYLTLVIVVISCMIPTFAVVFYSKKKVNRNLLFTFFQVH